MDGDFDLPIRTPVVLVPGVNHGQISSGHLPSVVRQSDLVADRTYDQAYDLISNVTNAFLVLNGKMNSTIIRKQATEIVGRFYTYVTAPVCKVSD